MRAAALSFKMLHAMGQGAGKALPVLMLLTILSGAFWSAPASASAVYWNLFNIEGESSANAIYVTYGSLLDMLNDTNRTGSFSPNTTGLSAANVVGSGASVMLATEIAAPGTLALFGIGLAGLGISRRKRAVGTQLQQQ